MFSVLGTGGALGCCFCESGDKVTILIVSSFWKCLSFQTKIPIRVMLSKEQYKLL